jgi:hypothetical protein
MTDDSETAPSDDPSGCFAIGNTVLIPDDLYGVIREVDQVNQKILIEYTGSCEEDGMQEWWPLLSLKLKKSLGTLGAIRR